MSFEIKILTKPIRKFKSFFSIGKNERFSFVQAFIFSGFYRAFILFIPFNKLKKQIGKHKFESPKEVDLESITKAKEVRWAVTQAAKHTPWESKCLVQALTASNMMKIKGISTTLYLGVKKNENNEMIAHAWVRCGDFYITGGDNRWGYVVVATFST